MVGVVLHLEVIVGLCFKQLAAALEMFLTLRLRALFVPKSTKDEKFLLFCVFCVSLARVASKRRKRLLTRAGYTKKVVFGRLHNLY